MSPPLRMAILVSGRGSNLQAVIDARDDGRLDADIVAVGSNRPGARALVRAQRAGIATFAFRQVDYRDRPSLDRALFDTLATTRPDLVVLAGFMRILDDRIVAAAPWPIVNIHPSLLPRHPGLDTHARALAAGDRVHGASVHRVIPALDAGAVIAQVRIAIAPDESPEAIAQRLLPREHALLVATVCAIAQGRITLAPAAIQFDGSTLQTPLILDDHDELVSATRFASAV